MHEYHRNGKNYFHKTIIVKKAINAGINKVNIDTDLRLAFMTAERDVLDKNKKQFDPRKILGPAREAISDVVQKKMKLFGSSGKA